MHLDTVFTLLDCDKATAYPKVVGNIRESLRPGKSDGDFHVTVESDFGTVANALGIKKLEVVETGGDSTSKNGNSGTTVTTSSPQPVSSLHTNGTRTIAKCAPRATWSRSRFRAG
jgi:arginine deiminase